MGSKVKRNMSINPAKGSDAEPVGKDPLPKLHEQLLLLLNAHSQRLDLIEIHISHIMATLPLTCSANHNTFATNGYMR